MKAPMPSGESSLPQRPNPLLYVACYAVWMLACVLLLWSMLVIRNDILVLTSILSLHPFTTAAIDRVMLIGLGLLSLVLVVIFENALRTAIPRRRFWPRTIRLTLGLATLLAGTYVAGYLLLRLS